MMTSEGEVVRTGHSACSVSTLDNLTDEDMTKYTVKVSTWSIVLTRPGQEMLSHLKCSTGPENDWEVGGDQRTREEKQESP